MLLVLAPVDFKVSAAGLADTAAAVVLLLRCGAGAVRGAVILLSGVLVAIGVLV